MMRGGCIDPFGSKNRVIEEQKTKKQEAHNVAIAMLKGLPLSFLALLSSKSAEIVSLPAAGRLKKVLDTQQGNRINNRS